MEKKQYSMLPTLSVVLYQVQYSARAVKGESLGKAGRGPAGLPASPANAGTGASCTFLI